MNKDTKNQGYQAIVCALQRASAAGGHRVKRGYRERLLAGGLVLTAALSALANGVRAQTPSDGSTPDLRVTVLVYCYAEVASDVLHRGEADAGGIIGAAGVGTRWVDCPTSQSQWQAPSGPATEDCARQRTDATLTLRILPRSSPANTAFRKPVTGFAYGGSLASVLYGRVEDLDLDVDNNGREIPVILGHAMAHELGHLLLGSNSHSSSGIMCGNWDRKYLRQAMQGGQSFTAEQSELLRANVRNRLEKCLVVSCPANKFQ